MLIITSNETNNKFYNLTIEDSNGESSVFVTQYIASDNWLNDQSQIYEGNITTMSLDKFTHLPPDDDGGGSDLASGVGNNNSNGSGSPYYPTDCSGVVIVTIEDVPYPCSCSPSHMPWENCICEETQPGYNQIPYYYCDSSGGSGTGGSDPDPFDSGSSGGSFNNTGSNGQNDSSITVILGPGGECDVIPPASLNGDCIIDQLGITNTAAQNFIINNTDISNVIIDYLEVNNYSDYAISSSIHIIEYLTVNPSVDFNEIMLEEVLVGPNNPIENMEEYLECFDLTQDANIIIYVDQPIANSDQPFTTGGDKAGHSFVGITQGNITRHFGFYPEGNASPFNPEDPPAFGNNANDPYDVNISKNISAFQLSAIISETLSYNENYHLSYNNCTDFAVIISQLSGFDIPQTIGDWLGGSGLNPGDFGQDIRDMNLEEGMNRETDTGNAPSNNGNCN